MRPRATQKQKQSHLLYPDLLNQLDPLHPLLVLAKNIPWQSFEDHFLPLYATKGRVAKPIRLMVGLLLLKQIENLSDERVVEVWVQNPYYQAFCGMGHFQWKFPCNPTDLVHFRHRIGTDGVEKIFEASVKLHGEKAVEPDVVIDTTVQEKNITFPTDTKLRMGSVSLFWKIAKKENIALRRSYKRELKKLLTTIRFSKGHKKKKEVTAAIRRVKTISNVLLREILRKLSSEALSFWEEKLNICERAINQKREDKNKIYSLHEPEVCCIGKGKVHKKYEFGSKSAIAMTKNSCIIVGVQSISDNRHDSKTLPDLLAQIFNIRELEVQTAFCDRGFRGPKKIGNTTISIPQASARGTSKYAKEKARKNFRRRSAIEPVIGHLKSDFRLARNYLKGSIGDTINLLLAAAAFNFKKWMRTTAKELLFCLFFTLNFLRIFLCTVHVYFRKWA